MKNKQNIRFGFVGAGYSPTASKIIYSTNAQMYLHIIFLEMENGNRYSCHGMTAFNKDKIKFPYCNHEFKEFYGNNPPKLSNNKKKAVNEFVRSVIVN